MNPPQQGPPDDATVEKLHEALWGGPRGEGLVYVVRKIAKATELHGRIIFGNGADGLRSKVDRHQSFIDRFETAQSRLIWLLVAQILTILAAGGYVVLRLAFQNG